jgi:hypothetical protein
MWDAAQNILGFPISEWSWKQACLTPRLGGIGLRRIVDHAEIAFAASWWEARDCVREIWAERQDTKNASSSQQRGSFKKDQEILELILQKAPNPRERQRLVAV